ncbi:MAG: hypothetical protein NVSMB23_29220 [Myxococcales bacterium]
MREAFKLVLERDRKRKALTDRPRPPQPEPHPEPQPDARGDNPRSIPAAVRRAVWERDKGRCTWPMGDGGSCGARHRLELDHEVEVALGGKSTVGNLRLLCQGHNRMKAEERFGRTFMARFSRRRSGRDGSERGRSERDRS